VEGSYYIIQRRRAGLRGESRTVWVSHQQSPSRRVHVYRFHPNRIYKPALLSKHDLHPVSEQLGKDSNSLFLFNKRRGFP